MITGLDVVVSHVIWIGNRLVADKIVFAVVYLQHELQKLNEGASVMVAESAASRHMIMTSQGVEGTSQTWDAQCVSNLDILPIDANRHGAAA